MVCPACSSSNIGLINIRYALFRHMDFTAIRDSGRIGRCRRCQLLFNAVDENAIVHVDNLFRSEAYSQSGQTNHTLMVNDYKKPVTRSLLQAELLRKVLQRRQPSILDIGCFDGRLVAELDRRLESAELHGFDVSEHFRSAFPRKKNFHFWSSRLENVQGKFDLICMSHSIEYITDITRLMKQVKRLIKPDGLLFVQTPDISKNPCSILLGDQFYYYTSNILKNILGYHGFEFSSIDNEWFPREMIGIARLAPHRNFGGYLEDLEIYRCAAYLDNAASNFREIMSRGRIGVLGTTVNAAFVNSVLGSRIDFIVDENEKKVGTVFCEKLVKHPRSLIDTDLLIMPYGETSRQMKQRFEQKYNGQFICI